MKKSMLIFAGIALFFALGTFQPSIHALAAEVSPLCKPYIPSCPPGQHAYCTIPTDGSPLCCYCVAE